jgi:hypothetical protein
MHTLLTAAARRTPIACEVSRIWFPSRMRCIVDSSALTGCSSSAILDGAKNLAHNLDQPKYDVGECRQRGMIYAAPIGSECSTGGSDERVKAS